MSSSRRRPAFTIVEMLVVISIIAVLAGLLLPALAGAQRRGRKADEINRIRQVGIAWNLYASSNRDSALPGVLQEGVQDAWNVRYKLATTVEGDGNLTPGQVAEPDAISWPWRLMPYLDFSDEMILGHLDKDLTGPFAMSDYGLVDDDLPLDEQLPRPSEIALQPGFGYNAYYIGGWWRLLDDQPRFRFFNATSIPEDPSEDPQRIAPVVRSPSNVQNSTQLILFCSSAELPTGEHIETPDQLAGSHYVVPPVLAEERMWGKSSQTASDTVIQIDEATSAPIARYTDQVAVLHADLHTEPWAPGQLDDQRFWINSAAGRFFRHMADPESWPW